MESRKRHTQDLVRKPNSRAYTPLRDLCMHVLKLSSCGSRIKSHDISLVSSQVCHLLVRLVTFLLHNETLLVRLTVSILHEPVHIVLKLLRWHYYREKILVVPVRPGKGYAGCADILSPLILLFVENLFVVSIRVEAVFLQVVAADTVWILGQYFVVV